MADGRVLADFPMDEVERQFGAPTICIHRADLLDVLAHVLGNGPIRLGARCVRFEEDDSGVRVHCADGRVVSGHFLVGADGIRSAVRAQLHGANGLRYAGHTCWRGVAMLEHSALLPGLTTETWGRGRRFGLCPLGNRRIGWWATRNAPQAMGDDPKARKRDVQQTFRGWHEPIEAVLEATEAGVILRHDVFDLKPRRRWGHGRVTLLGDAAHATTPDLGQGACLAIEDAFVLARCLAQTEDIVSALRHYENKRRKMTARMGRWARWQGSIGQWEGPLACAFRDATCRLTPSAVQMRTFKALIKPLAPP
ncbi:MAG: FAD-dependent monooxygenase [Acidobacteriota bacterium]